MGVPNRDVTPMPAPRALRFTFRRVGAKRWRQPEGIHGLELAWVIATAPPKETEGLVHSSFATKSPPELTFKENERGKRAYYAARWETGAMKKGKFTDIVSVIVSCMKSRRRMAGSLTVHRRFGWFPLMRPHTMRRGKDPRNNVL
ncbi:MAG: hypothetical protein LBP19_00790 [Treponema sp.]|jgi:hypothetical protein|nr:hypothetical protein [Treponema sp.]